MQWTRGAWCAALASLAATTHATDLTLGTDDLAALSVEAREEYDQAVADFDHAYLGGGVRHLNRAAAAAPDVIALQFLMVSVTLDEIDGLSSPAALEAIAWVAEAHLRVLENPEAAEWQVTRAARDIESLPALVTQIGRRTRELSGVRDAFVASQVTLYHCLGKARAWAAMRAQRAEPRDPNAPHPLPLPSDEPGDEQGSLPTSDNTRRFADD